MFSVIQGVLVPANFFTRDGIKLIIHSDRTLIIKVKRDNPYEHN